MKFQKLLGETCPDLKIDQKIVEELLKNIFEPPVVEDDDLDEGII